MNSTEFSKLRMRAENFSSGFVKYLHEDKEEWGSAFEKREKCEISFFIPRAVGAEKLYLRLFDEKLSLIKTVQAVWKGIFKELDEYRVILCQDTGLYFFDVEIEASIRIFGCKKVRNEIEFVKEEKLNLFQLTISDFKYEAPTDIYGGIIYHIFVDRFSRSTKTSVRKDATFVSDWYSLIPEYPSYTGAYMRNDSFFGGDLYGVESKLDYLISLGVNVIYLSPIFESKSNHKYDTSDYMKIDDGFGGERAFSLLLEKCKSKNIKVILDGVFNHTGSDSIYFNKNSSYDSVGAFQSKKSKYYDWYNFFDYPEKYECWWGIDILPRINTRNKECGSFFVGDNGVIEHYCKSGVYGFRLDVADELSDEFIAEIKTVLDRHLRRSVLYGEVWEDASNKIAYGERKKYYLGKELDGVMNYPLRDGIIDFLRNKKTEKLEFALYEVMMNMPKRIRNATMNLLGTHDTERILTALGAELALDKDNDYLHSASMSDAEYKRAKKLLMLAYTIVSTLPGVPSIFYADETGMEGYSDPFNRRCYPWGREDKELLDFYRIIGKIRRDKSVYKEGNFKICNLSDEMLLFERYTNQERCITVINNSQQTKSISFSDIVTELITNRKIREFNLLPYSSAIFCSSVDEK